MTASTICLRSRCVRCNQPRCAWDLPKCGADSATSAKTAKRTAQLHACKPVPLVRNRQGQLWMVDRHHRLRALLEMDADVSTYGYVIAELDSVNRNEALKPFSKGLALSPRWPWYWTVGPIRPPDLSS